MKSALHAELQNKATEISNILTTEGALRSEIVELKSAFERQREELQYRRDAAVADATERSLKKKSRANRRFSNESQEDMILVSERE